MSESKTSSPPPAVEPPEPPVLLREPASSPSAPVASGDTLGQADLAAPAPPARVGRYEVLEEIAHGGMGAIFKVRDPDLGRTLAMKVLLDQHGKRPDLARRFLEEAQIGGQLQHPGLVPVHALGRLPDQRAFFTMKLVKGRTLAELLRERSSPSADLPRFLGIFEQVCQTLAYTHSRGGLCNAIAKNGKIGKMSSYLSCPVSPKRQLRCKARWRSKCSGRNRNDDGVTVSFEIAVIKLHERRGVHPRSGERGYRSLDFLQQPFQTRRGGV
jgi:hypothetical protein